MVAMKFVGSVVVLFAVSSLAQGKEPASASLETGRRFEAVDTLACGAETSDDARECLERLTWPPAKFDVYLEAAEPGYGEWLVRFPSARPIGIGSNDRVAMEWYAPRDDAGTIRDAPAIVVVHESGRRMTVGRLIAQSFSTQGLHAFLLHLPGYGTRRVEGLSKDTARAFPAILQAIADVRRARDAVAVLPGVDRMTIGLQGTSLGGFVTATAAGLDRGYNRVFILLAGGNLPEVVFNGAKDAAKLRAKLAAAGITDDQIKEFARQVEPLRLAHRLDPAATWLYSGKYDEVVPPSSSRALAKAARLPAGHHIEFPGSHYSGVLFLPQAVQEMSDRMKEPREER
jgi:dienelactone hydrolase